MGRPHVYSLHTHYPMRDLIAPRLDVCAHYEDASLYFILWRLNFNYASTESLFNAAKEQYSNSHLPELALPGLSPLGVPSPALLPRLPNNTGSMNER